MGLESGPPWGWQPVSTRTRRIDALAALGFGFVEVGTATGRAPARRRRPGCSAAGGPRGRQPDGLQQRRGRGGRVLAGRRTVCAAAARRWCSASTSARPRPCPSPTTTWCSPTTRSDEGRFAPYADYLVVNVTRPTPRPAGPAVGRAAPPAADRRTPPGRRGLRPPGAPAGEDRPRPLRRRRPRRGRPGPRARARRDRRHQHHDQPRGAASSRADVARVGAGGLSGRPLRDRALEVLVAPRPAGAGLTIIAVGGISDAHDARERLEAGATLLQAYTAFVYEGVRLAQRGAEAAE